MVWLALLALARPAAAQNFPILVGRVVDEAGILSPTAERSLADASSALEARTSDQLVIVTVQSLGGLPIETYSTALGNRWGLGQKRLDNGVLLVVAPRERKVRIAVGFGLEGLLTDARSAAIVRHILPFFRANQLEGGVMRADREIIATLMSDRRRPKRKVA